MFSVVIPVYNRADLVEKAISSVLNQSFPEFELIMVDDFSTDNSVAVMKKFTDKRIKIISLNENGGNAKARNFGWKAAKGEWVVYLDSDDWFEPDYLQVLFKNLSAYPKASFFWSGVRFVNHTGKTIKEEFWKPKEPLPSTTFFDELRIGTNCGVAFKKDLLEHFNGFDESFKASVDREFFLRISRQTSGQGITEVLVNCLLGDHESVRKNYKAQFDAYSKMVHIYRDEVLASSSRKKWWYHKSMWLALYCHDFRQARSFLKLTGYSLKSVILYFIFFLFPLEVAKELHKKLS